MGASVASLESGLTPGGAVFIPDLALPPKACCTDVLMLYCGFTLIGSSPGFASLPFPEGEM